MINIRLVVTTKVNAVVRQIAYNCDTLGHASQIHERERARPHVVRIQTFALLDDWRPADMLGEALARLNRRRRGDHE